MTYIFFEGETLIWNLFKGTQQPLGSPEFERGLKLMFPKNYLWKDKLTQPSKKAMNCLSAMYIHTIMHKQNN